MKDHEFKVNLGYIENHFKKEKIGGEKEGRMEGEKKREIKEERKRGKRGEGINRGGNSKKGKRGERKNKVSGFQYLPFHSLF